MKTTHHTNIKCYDGFRALFIVSCICFLSPNKLFATHNRGGEITYKHLSGLNYEFIITTYTKINAAADRPKIEIKWGDNITDSLNRNQQTNITSDIKKNTYIGTHTFPASGNYKISVEDPNRNLGVINIPNSVYVPFYIETFLAINPFTPPNNSVLLLNPPIDNGCVDRLFVHNPNAYDADGDSLSYLLVACKGERGLPIIGFRFPNASNSLTINPQTGQLIWDKPTQIGEYNIAIKITEWRNGLAVGSVLRDMQIDITVCQNNPPRIQTLRDTCIEIGKTLSLGISATDPDPNNLITLSATGAPLNFGATFPQNTGNRTVISQFNWTPACNAVRKLPYQMLFKAADSGSPALVDLKTWNITVVATAPTLVSAQSSGGKITLNWNTYLCSNARGFKIYRRKGSFAFTPSVCQTGMPNFAGYELIDTLMGINRTTYTDTDKGKGLGSGAEYCYRISAFFSPFANFPLDGAESYVSNEICNVVKRDLPVITKVDVNTTNTTNGQVLINWAKPNALDTNQFGPPYKYELYRTVGFQNNNITRQLIKTQTANTFANLTDTSFIDNTPNTASNANAYQIDFLYNGTEKVGLAKASSSVFLKAAGLPNRIQLKWNFEVGWSNDSFYVFRKNGNAFQKIATIVGSTNYTDIGLVNGLSYCYYVESIGQFKNNPTLRQIIANKSQQVCGTPKDTIPPCNPTFKLTSQCTEYQNTLRWNYQTTDSLGCAADLKFFNIYYKPKLSDEFKILVQLDKNQRTFTHTNLQTSVAGCYAVVAVDSSNNANAIADTLCIDNTCHEYKIPNAITPNGDNLNETLMPFANYRFVRTIDFRLYNRWGIEVFRTQNPNIDWEPKNEPSGTYFYTCKITFIGLENDTSKKIKGTVELIK